jgi:hypothetical protein
MADGTTEAVKEILKEVLAVANETGRAERERLGRNLTDAEARELGIMVERQFRLALAMVAR